MAVVTEYLFQLIAKQVEDRGLVVWYDPEKTYAQAASELTLPQTTIARYSDSFFRLRHEIDQQLNDGQPPRLVVYVPMPQEETNDALIELEAAGIVMRPGQQPPNRNTKLAVVARNALRPILGDDQIGEIEKQVETGKLSLADLNALAEKGKDISAGVLSLIFGTANPQEVALAFLHDEHRDAEIEKKAAEKELRGLLQLTFNIELPASIALANLRERLARYVLLTDLITALGSKTPASLSSVKVATSPGGVDSCVRLARSWRNKRDARDSYVDAAKKTEQEYKLAQIAFDPPTIIDNESFLAIEKALMRDAEKQLLEAARPDLLRLAVARQSRFWAEVEPAVQARWALIAAAAEVLLEADRVAKEIKKPTTTVPALVKAYADGEDPWCLLDTHHRHLETRKYNFDFAADGEHQGLDKLIAKAEQRYMEVGSALAKNFVTAYKKAQHPIKGMLRQRDFFGTQVKPRLGDGRIAYVWVDALRFEMARELCRLLRDDFDYAIQPAIGSIPTITEIGMAALLPGADQSAKVVGVGGGKLGLEIGGTVVKDRKDRVSFLKDNAGVPVFDCKIDDLLPKPNKRVKEGIQSAELVLVTSQEIDELCEADNIAQARLQMDGVLGQLRRSVRILGDLGIKTIILVADHGHLFADEIGEDMKIEAPGGKTEDLHRRAWVGVGGTSQAAYLRTSLSSLGVESDFDIATPWTFACFKSKGGARAYFHGGLSPQELIVPVVVLTPRAKTGAPRAGIDWTLTPGTTKLTTRFFSLQIGGVQDQSSLFGFEPPKVRIEVRANKKCVSIPVSASYGFEDATGEVRLKTAEHDTRRIETNTVTVMIAEEVSQKTVGVYLIDATTGAELAAPLTVEVAISM
ncbi:MAG: PglZ domain-containing protein [Thermoguttaceae bacterium]